MNSIQDAISLKTIIWIYDIERHRIIWANNAALEWWHAESISALNSRDFSNAGSAAVRQGLLDYQKRFINGESFPELWQFLPNGIKKQAFCQFSGFEIDGENGEKKMAMLVEATPVDIISPHMSADSAVIFATFSVSGELQSANPTFKSQFGKNHLHLKNMLFEPAEFDQIINTTATNRTFEKDIKMHTPNGESWFEARLTASTSENGKPFLLCHLYNIDERKNKELDLLQQAQSDALTGLLNRRGLREKMKAMLNNSTPFYLFYIDLDGFKMINDSLGHGIGDTLLKDVSSRLQLLQIENSLICRFGGDEFVLIVYGQLALDDAANLATNMVAVLSRPYRYHDDKVLVISASIGYSNAPFDSHELDDIIRYADAAMYHSKKLGKKRSTRFLPGMDKAILRKSLVAQHLFIAIEKNELSLNYQAIVNTKDNTIDSFEALLRWYNPDLGHVSPQELINVAEDIGLIEEIENWVIVTALSSLHRLRKQTDSQAGIAINISSLHIVSDSLPKFLRDNIALNNLLPSDVIIEITESVLLDDVDESKTAISNITDMGVHLSIDDFGTGYSSLAYLHNINASIAKIDRTFLSEKSRSKTTLDAIQKLISSMGMRVLVEGVETLESANLCKQLGITLHQGYFYARPQKIEDIKPIISPKGVH